MVVFLNPKLQKVIKDIERTRAKIAELSELLPGLEAQKTELENLDIIKAVRSANIAPGELTAFVAAYRAGLNRQPALSTADAQSPPAPVHETAATGREKEGDLDNEGN